MEILSQCQNNLNTDITSEMSLTSSPIDVLPLLPSPLIATIRERERVKKAPSYKAYSNPKLRLGCSNIQGPKPFDLWLTSSKALIYYYY